MPDLSYLEKDMLIAWFKHHLTVDLRGRLMAEMPQAYNRLHARHIVHVTHIDDGRVERGSDR